jgi:hypothetical protein
MISRSLVFAPRRAAYFWNDCVVGNLLFCRRGNISICIIFVGARHDVQLATVPTPGLFADMMG